MQFPLRTLLIILALGPPVLALSWWAWTTLLPPPWESYPPPMTAPLPPGTLPPPQPGDIE